MTLTDRVEALRHQAAILSEVLQRFTTTISPPIFYNFADGHTGFRFLKPEAKHFCILKAARAVSGIHAAIKLWEGGFGQEICVLVRTIVDCTSHVEFILAGLEKGELPPQQQKLVEGFFSDFERKEPKSKPQSQIRQGDIHKEVGKHLDEALKGVEGGGRFAGIETSALMSNGYLRFSNYVHAKYPEVMDLYGGQPGEFHLGGMRGTPKDFENLEIIECYIVTVSDTLRMMIHKFGLVEEMRRSPHLMQWLIVSGSTRGGGV